MVDIEQQLVRCESLDEGRYLRLVLNAGKGNVIDSRVMAALREIVAGLGFPAPLRAILIDHEGKHFSFGASVEEHVPAKAAEMLAALHALAGELLRLDVPIVSAVRGQCLGGGLELAALADRIFAAPTAFFGQPEIQLAVFAPIGSLLMPRLVGQRCAVDLLLSGRSVDAAEARAMGLVAEVADDPTEAALAWLRASFDNKSASALRAATRAARHNWQGRFLSDLAELERLYLDELMSTNDAVEGIQAFIEKRKPIFTDD